MMSMSNFTEMRCRIPFTHMTAKWIAHGERWLRGRGSCHHATRIDTAMLKRFFNLMRDMEKWNKDYQNWIKDNEYFKPENYLLEKS